MSRYINLKLKKNWLLLSHAFNMDGRAASLTITDKMPYLLEAGIQPCLLYTSDAADE